MIGRKMSNHLPSTESNVWLNQTKTFNLPNTTKVVVSYLFFYFSDTFASNKKNKWVLQNENKQTLKAPQARGGLPSELAAVDIRSFFERQKCTQLIYGLGDFYDRKKKWKRTCKPIVFSEKNAFDLLTSTMHKRFGKNKT